MLYVVCWILYVVYSMFIIVHYTYNLTCACAAYDAYFRVAGDGEADVSTGRGGGR
jgi:hypothetical protein